MNCCGHCQDAGRIFGDGTAKRELRRYLKRGPNKSTRMLLDEIRKHDLSGWSLLDIGSGVGAIGFELLDEGVARAVSVDASPAYVSVSRAEAARKGVADRSHHLAGDFTSIPDDIPNADVVTLDRSICCYPHMKKLVDQSTEKAGRLYGVVYPRNRWSVRAVMRIGNIVNMLRRIDFRTYVHPPREIDERIRANGFKRVKLLRTMVWEVALYERVG